VFRRRRVLIAALLVTLLAPAAAAHASAYSDVLKTYERKGTIPPCQYSSRVLTSALKEVDTYGAQYFADFTAAIQTALDNQASGECVVRHHSAAATSTVPPLANNHAAPLSLPALTAATGAGIPLPLLILAIISGLALLAGAATALAVTRGWDPPAAAAWRHVWQEAGYRTGGTWAEFVDWVRSA
jgi:hypothetical protein